jgi:hypothetical protein
VVRELIVDVKRHRIPEDVAFLGNARAKSANYLRLGARTNCGFLISVGLGFRTLAGISRDRVRVGCP